MSYDRILEIIGKYAAEDTPKMIICGYIWRY